MKPKPTVHFAGEELRPAKSNISQSANGVYPIRSYPAPHGRNGSVEFVKYDDSEYAEDEDAGLRDERDFKRKQVGSTSLYKVRNI